MSAAVTTKTNKTGNIEAIVEGAKKGLQDFTGFSVIEP
jgi:hypothetical protein